MPLKLSKSRLIDVAIRLEKSILSCQDPTKRTIIKQSNGRLWKKNGHHLGLKMESIKEIIMEQTERASEYRLGLMGLNMKESEKPTKLTDMESFGI